MIGLGLIAAGLTYVLPSLTKTFNIVTGIGAVTVPVASTIMVMDVFVLPRLFGIKRPLHRVATWGELAVGNWPAIVALLAGTAVGAVTGGLIPGTSGFGVTYVGSPPIQAWLTGAVVVSRACRVCSRKPITPRRSSASRSWKRSPKSFQRWLSVTEGLDLVVRAPRVIIPGAGETAAEIGIRDGRIVAVVPLGSSLDAAETWEFEPDVVVMPGLVDSHVHVCEPGNTEWEGFQTATRPRQLPAASRPWSTCRLTVCPRPPMSRL